MEKMRMESADLVSKNVEKIAALFPNCITETLDEERSTGSEKVYKKVINFDKLRQMLSGDLLDCIESYEFTWGEASIYRRGEQTHPQNFASL